MDATLDGKIKHIVHDIEEFCSVLVSSTSLENNLAGLSCRKPVTETRLLSEAKIRVLGPFWSYTNQFNSKQDNPFSGPFHLDVYAWSST